MGKAIVALKGVNKWYGNNHVVKDLDLEVAESEFLGFSELFSVPSYECVR